MMMSKRRRLSKNDKSHTMNFSNIKCCTCMYHIDEIDVCDVDTISNTVNYFAMCPSCFVTCGDCFGDASGKCSYCVKYGYCMGCCGIKTELTRIINMNVVKEVVCANIANTCAMRQCTGCINMIPDRGCYIDKCWGCYHHVIGMISDTYIPVISSIISGYVWAQIIDDIKHDEKKDNFLI